MDATEWVDQSGGGSGNVPDSDSDDSGRVLTVNDAGDDEDWGVLDVALAVSTDEDTVTVSGLVTSTIPAGGSEGQQASPDAVVPVADGDNAGVLTAADKRIIDSVTPGASLAVGAELLSRTLERATGVTNLNNEYQTVSPTQLEVFLNSAGAGLIGDARLLRIDSSSAPINDGDFVISRVSSETASGPRLFRLDGRWINLPDSLDRAMDADGYGVPAGTGKFYAAQSFFTPGSGGGAVDTSVVAYSSFSDTTSARDWRTESHAEVDNYDGNENVNIGSFTTATRDSVTDGAVVIPEDGTYSVRFAAEAVVGNTSGNAEYWGRVRMYLNGTKVRDGEVGHSRGQIISGSGNFDNLSTCEVACILDLDEDDELHATFESDQQNNSTTATLEMKVDIHKIGGAKGDTGSDGDDGAVGATGTDGATGAQGIQGLQGIQGDAGNDGDDGTTATTGDHWRTGRPGHPGHPGNPGHPRHPGRHRRRWRGRRGRRRSKPTRRARLLADRCDDCKRHRLGGLVRHIGRPYLERHAGGQQPND